MELLKNPCKSPLCIVCRGCKMCEFLGFVWTDCWGQLIQLCNHFSGKLEPHAGKRVMLTSGISSLYLWYHTLPWLYFVCVIVVASGGKVVEEIIGIPNQEEFLQAYCRRTRTRYPVPNWEFYLALAFFKICSICQVIMVIIIWFHVMLFWQRTKPFAENFTIRWLKQIFCICHIIVCQNNFGYCDRIWV